MTPIVIAGALALLMFGLLIEAVVFKIRHDDPPSTYKLFAVRDDLIRLVVEGKIARNDPFFDAIYNNINVMLASSLDLSGPQGWALAVQQGTLLAHHPKAAVELKRVPQRQEMPAVLEPAAKTLRGALTHLVTHHFGVMMQITSRQRETVRLQKQRAKQMLGMIPSGRTECRA